MATTLQKNMDAHGTGALNIDDCRIGTNEQLGRFNNEKPAEHRVPDSHPNARNLGRMQSQATWVDNSTGKGRWPANVVLHHSGGCRQTGTKRVPGHKGYPDGPKGKSFQYSSDKRGEEVRPDPWPGHADPDGLETVEAWACVPGCPIRELDEQSGDRPSGTGAKSNRHSDWFEGGPLKAHGSASTGGDSGGASRFFLNVKPDPPFLYCAKASRRERNAGLDGFEAVKSADDGYGSIQTPKLDRVAPRENWTPHKTANNHPTVKPIALMRWLVRLFCPPGGRILDPFCGSGTTGIAAILEGFDFVGIEQDPEYARIAQARIRYWQRVGPAGFDRLAELDRGEQQHRSRVEAGQLALEGLA